MLIVLATLTAPCRRREFTKYERVSRLRKSAKSALVQSLREVKALQTRGGSLKRRTVECEDAASEFFPLQKPANLFDQT
jgi:hypothetical protein